MILLLPTAANAIYFLTKRFLFCSISCKAFAACPRDTRELTHKVKVKPAAQNLGVKLKGKSNAHIKGHEVHSGLLSYPLSSFINPAALTVFFCSLKTSLCFYVTESKDLFFSVSGLHVGAHTQTHANMQPHKHTYPTIYVDPMQTNVS